MEKNKEYKSLVEKHIPSSRTIQNALRAFVGGGALCLVGEVISSLFIYMGAQRRDAYLYVTLIFIFLGSTLTALGVFDKMTKFILAGGLVPVCGFANSLTSAAMDAACDGHTVGVGAKIFAISGPVILYGTFTGAIYGIIYYICTLIWR
jgi:stage V sporulation protein AC